MLAQMAAGLVHRLSANRVIARCGHGIREHEGCDDAQLLAPVAVEKRDLFDIVPGLAEYTEHLAPEARRNPKHHYRDPDRIRGQAPGAVV